MSSEGIAPADTRVCVTGAAGFVGSHIVKELLDRGYIVHACVRDPANEDKVAHLRKLEGAADRLKLFKADLTVEGAYKEALESCDYVIHAAAVVKFNAKDPQREIIDITVQGAKNVFNMIKDISSIKRVVMTSSVAAINGQGEQPPEYVYTDKDWNKSSTVKNGPYMLAKTQAEKFAWDFAKEHNIDLVCINPALVVGPLLAKNHMQSSPQILADICNGKFGPGVPALGFSFIDVRDVAVAHVNAMERKEASGRYILAPEFHWLLDVSRRFAATFPSTKAPTRRLPNFLMYVAAVFDPRLTWAFLKDSLDKPVAYDSSRARNDLGVEFHDILGSCEDTVRTMAQFNVIKTLPPSKL